MSEAISIQVKPINPTVACAWDNAWSDYPDVVKIPMEDGHVITYRREIEQPDPRVMKSIDLIRVMNRCTYGGYKPKHKENSR